MGTKKILNKDVSNVVEESLAGYLMAYRKYYKKVGEYNAFTYKGHRKDKVALVIGLMEYTQLENRLSLMPAESPDRNGKTGRLLSLFIFLRNH